ADDGEWDPVDVKTASHYRGIGAVLVLPDVEAHHRHRRRALLVVGIGSQTADPGLHAEGPEEIAGSKLPVSRLHRRGRSRSPYAERRVPGLHGRQLREFGRVLSKV